MPRRCQAVFDARGAPPNTENMFLFLLFRFGSTIPYTVFSCQREGIVAVI